MSINPNMPSVNQSSAPTHAGEIKEVEAHETEAEEEVQQPQQGSVKGKTYTKDPEPHEGGIRKSPGRVATLKARFEQGGVSNISANVDRGPSRSMKPGRLPPNRFMMRAEHDLQKDPEFKTMRQQSARGPRR